MIGCAIAHLSHFLKRCTQLRIFTLGDISQVNNETRIKFITLNELRSLNFSSPEQDRPGALSAMKTVSAFLIVPNLSSLWTNAKLMTLGYYARSEVLSLISDMVHRSGCTILSLVFVCDPTAGHLPSAYPECTPTLYAEYQVPKHGPCLTQSSQRQLVPTSPLTTRNLHGA